jgi:hypothetical protein
VSVTLDELKDLLLRFSWERRDWPREDVQREFGALVLHLMQQADRLGLDLVSAGEAGITHRAASASNPVPAGRDLEG